MTAEELRAKVLAELGSGKRNKVTIDGFKRAAVLVPLVKLADDYELLFTQRTDKVETHKGQIAFPGGMVDSGDNNIVDAALREAFEEVGLEKSKVEIAGLLDDLATPSGFIITPVVGIIENLPMLSPNPEEVADVFTAPLAFFREPRNGRTEMHVFRGVEREVWYYQYGKHNIWGVTAMIIRSLLKKLGLL